MSNGIEPVAGGRAHRFVMRKQPPLPVTPPSALPPIRCTDCGCCEMWCPSCNEDHPIRAIEHHVHIAHCHQHQREMRHPCPIPGKAARDKAEADALDPLQHERKREIAAATVGLCLGFILGVVVTLATIVSLNLAYRPHQSNEQHIER